MSPSVHQLLKIFAALTPCVTGACARGIDTSQFSEDLCAGEELRIVGSITPAIPVDYAEFRTAAPYGGYDAPYVISVLDSAGEFCGRSTDPTQCEQAFAELSAMSAFPAPSHDIPKFLSVAYTRSDEVGVILDQATLSSFLGLLDSPADAALWAALQGHQLVCTDDLDAGVDGGAFTLHTRTGGGCGKNDDIQEHVVQVTPEGMITVIESELIKKGDPNCIVGRLPAGLDRGGAYQRARPVATYLTEMAELEAAAVPAFEQLTRELAVHDAPRSLIAAAQRSRADEVQHARAIARHARRYGGSPVRPRVHPVVPRSLEAVAAENMAEGCVRETYGALVAHVQAQHAQDPALRSTMQMIALDETRHAALSWAFHHWASTRLGPTERQRIASVARDATERLRTELRYEHAEEVHTLAGVPRPHQAQALFDSLRAALAS